MTNKKILPVLFALWLPGVCVAAGANDLSQQLSTLTNPVFHPDYNVRDPAIYQLPDGGFQILFSKFLAGAWSDPAKWSIASVRTRDFQTFADVPDISPKGFASPDNPVRWGDRTIMAFQSYPAKPVRLCYVVRDQTDHWSTPTLFLEEAAHLPWNKEQRVIDPTLVVDGATLHCFFVGTATVQGKRSNLLGHAVTTDPNLKDWTILSKSEPIIGTSADAPDGVENITIVKDGTQWRMIYSAGLVNQHLAYATSLDLIKWDPGHRIEIPAQSWLKTKYGAPSVWKQGDQFWMLLMGEDNEHHTTLGLLHSPDAMHWEPLPERPAK